MASGGGLGAPPGKGVAGLCWVAPRLVGIYWISSVTKCEMNHIVNHPRGRAGEEELSIKEDLQSSHSHRLLESVSPADCSLTFNALGPWGWGGSRSRWDVEKEKKKKKKIGLWSSLSVFLFLTFFRSVLNLRTFSWGRRSFSVRRWNKCAKTTAKVTVECSDIKKY